MRSAPERQEEPSHRIQAGEASANPETPVENEEKSATVIAKENSSWTKRWRPLTQLVAGVRSFPFFGGRDCRTIRKAEQAVVFAHHIRVFMWLFLCACDPFVRFRFCVRLTRLDSKSKL